MGNLSGPKIEYQINQLKLDISNEQNGKPFHILLLGDVKQENIAKEDSLIAFFKYINELNGTIISVSGDQDWDKSSENGIDTVDHLIYRISQKLEYNPFLPSNNCPGPEVIDLNNKVRVIAINSQWWLHPYRKQLPIDSECNKIHTAQILEEIEDILALSVNKTVILMAHHPIISGGIYGGASNPIEHLFPGKHDNPSDQSLLPIYGSFYYNFRRNIGTTQDINSSTYQKYVSQLKNVLVKYKNIIVVSAHEYDIQMLKIDDNYQLIAGSIANSNKTSSIKNTLYKSSNNGFIKLHFSNDTLKASPYLYNKELKKFNPVIKVRLNSLLQKTTHKKYDLMKNEYKGNYFGGEYGAKWVKKILFGKLYRQEWKTLIDPPVLNLRTIGQGLTPIEEGGGLQTISLKFIDKFGRKYAFRSINKSPITSLPLEYRIGLVEDIYQDMTATQHPYGALYASKLLDATEIPHEAPKLYVMPDDSILGVHRSNFAGMLGFLELKPTQLEDKLYSYERADKVKGTYTMFNKLYSSSKHRIDTTLFAKTRIFDILIGDWDRHEDNWKWLGYTKNKVTTYKAFPKDRDHAFSKMDGLIYYLADRKWGLAWRENFGYRFKGIISLTTKGNHLDRMLLSGLSRDDWNKISNNLIAQITDSVIYHSLNAFPENILDLSGSEISTKLTSRRKKLSAAIDNYYLILSKEVDVIGTNQKEIFEIHVLNKERTRIKMISAKNGEVLYNRLFKSKETKEINLYGLGGNDSFYVVGISNSEILTRIIGGQGVDLISEYLTGKGKVKIVVLDYPGGILLSNNNKIKTIISYNHKQNEYYHNRHKNNEYLPIPIMEFNPDDGFGIGLSLNIKRFGFSHPKYKTKSRFSIFNSSNGALKLDIKHVANIARSSTNFFGEMNAGNSFRYYRFYGLGHFTKFNTDLNNQNFYRIRYKGLSINIGSTTEFLKSSHLKTYFIGEFFKDEYDKHNGIDQLIINQMKAINSFGIGSDFDLDFRDNPNFTSRGIRVIQRFELFKNSLNYFGKYHSEVSYYGTTKMIIPITLGLKVGLKRNLGKKIPFYHLSTLGRMDNLRGYFKNRYSGEGANYLNTDLRFHLGRTNSEYFPILYGVTLFADYGQIILNDKQFHSDWHSGYGFGIYLTPLNEQFFSLQFNLERSEELNTYVNIKFGILL